MFNKSCYDGFEFDDNPFDKNKQFSVLIPKKKWRDDSRFEGKYI